MPDMKFENLQTSQVVTLTQAHLLPQRITGRLGQDDVVTFEWFALEFRQSILDQLSPWAARMQNEPRRNIAGARWIYTFPGAQPIRITMDEGVPLSDTGVIVIPENSSLGPSGPRNSRSAVIFYAVDMIRYFGVELPPIPVGQSG